MRQLFRTSSALQACSTLCPTLILRLPGHGLLPAERNLREAVKKAFGGRTGRDRSVELVGRSETGPVDRWTELQYPTRGWKSLRGLGECLQVGGPRWSGSKLGPARDPVVGIRFRSTGGSGSQGGRPQESHPILSSKRSSTREGTSNLGRLLLLIDSSGCRGKQTFTDNSGIESLVVLFVLFPST